MAILSGDKRQLALARAKELKGRIADYLEYKKKAPTGFTEWEKIEKRQEKIKKIYGATEADWRDWKWQLRNRIDTLESLKRVIPLSSQEDKDISLVGSRFRWSVSPYYLSLIDPQNPSDPVRLQSIPTIAEHEDTSGVLDPMDEEYTSPAPAITRRYPDRLIINVTNQCPSYCRHCQRRRNIGEVDRHTPRRQMEAALDYIAQNEEIRDVLLTGGDALMLSDKTLDWILTELEKIPHVEIKRLGTRAPATLPYRVTNELCAILSRHLPLYINIQFNHPLEITPASRQACWALARCGINLGNQAVLLKGINNHPYLMRQLNQELLQSMVKPYYIFHAKGVRGTGHFRTRVEEGIEIMEQLRGFTSGLAVPTFIVNAPHGYGKTPMLSEYLISMGANKLLIRTWEKRILEYENDEEI
ncbi:MAG: glutamate 2,3-aminomutase [Firmicutes bacterium]|jgi:glutamate 2,3-aminomutase|nr:glutamate 2,3-aminomutase [Bacillota bacterium]